MRLVEKAYLAGLIDGEGCIAIVRQRSPKFEHGLRFYSTVTVSMTHKVVIKMRKLTRLGRVFVGKRKNPNCAKPYIWRVCSRETIELLNQVIPFLVVKKEHAKNLMHFQAGLGCGRGISKKEFNRQKRHYKTSRFLNRTGPK